MKNKKHSKNKLYAGTQQATFKPNGDKPAFMSLIGKQKLFTNEREVLLGWPTVWVQE